MIRIGRRQALTRTAMASLGFLTGGKVFGANARRGDTVWAAKPSFDDWASIRQQFELTHDWIHMAGLLFASHPTPVRQAIERHRRGFDLNPVDYIHENHGSRDDDVRQAAVRYFGGEPSEIALTDSTTMGLALISHGVILGPGDEVLTSEHDHYSTHESLKYRAALTGATVRKIRLFEQSAAANVDEILARIAAAVRDETRVLFLTWVHSATGVKLPLAAISQLVAEINASRAKDRELLFFVDGVHGFGIENVTFDELGADFFVAGTHKWIFGPRGTGVIFAKPGAWSHMAATIPSFTSFSGGSPGSIMTPGGFHSFEHRWAVGEAFDFHLSIGKARIEERIHGYATALKEALATMPHVMLHTPMAPSLSSGIVCFEVEGMTPAGTVEALRKDRIIASTTPYEVSYARLTPGILNTEADIEKTIAALWRLGK